MDQHFPAPPDIPVETVRALIEHADRCADYVSEEQRGAAACGHVAETQSLANLEGYRFTTLWLRESYEDRLSG